jgi:seryl-tRNA synthetase
MLDPRDVARDPDTVRAHLARRRADPATVALVDVIVEATVRRTAVVTERDEARARRNSVSKEIGGLMKQGQRDEAEARKAEVADINARIAALEAELDAIEATQRDAALRLPNLLAADVPDGAGEDDNVEVARWGEPADLGFTPQAHVEVGEGLGMLELERAARLTGTRFWALRGQLARLERALIDFFLDLHTSEHGYEEVMVPYLVHAAALEGTGQLPKFGGDMFAIEGEVNGAKAYLIPTAEVPVTNLHRGELLNEAQLPLKYVAFTPCFRSEAGSAGRDVRGLMRVHQFHKVELVQLCTAEQAEAAHEALTAHAEEALRRLGLPYRKVLLCGGDISFGAARCYDLEVWLPSQGKFREISSCSWFGDFQGRRMDTRYRPADDAKGKTRHVHTLNGSGLAVGRTLVAILENYQCEDGSVVVPEALRARMGTDRIVPAASAPRA